MAIQLAPQSTGTDYGSILSALPGIASLFTGKSSTTSESISPEGQQAMLTQLLSGTNGLASVAGAEHSAGLYNSSTNTQLTNDLLTRASAQVAQANKTTTTTQNAQLPAGKTAALASGGALALKLFNQFGGAKKAKDLLTGNGQDTSVASQIPGSTGLPANTAAFGGGSPGQFTMGGSSIPSISDQSAQSEINSFGGGPAGSSASGGINADYNTGGTAAFQSGLVDNGTFNLGGAAVSGGIGAGESLATTSGATALTGLGGSAGADVAADTAGIAAANGVGSDAAGFAADSANTGAGLAENGVGSYAGPVLGTGLDLAKGDTLGAAGTTAGAIAGSFIPGVGTAIGGAIGGFIGDNAGSWNSVVNSTYDPYKILLGTGAGLGDFGSHVGGAAASVNDFGTGVVSDALGAIGLGGVGNVVSDIGSGISGAIKSVFNCFITTAMVEYFGLPDTGITMRTLRAFRDGYMSSTPEMKADVEEYYKIAPGLVEKLNDPELISENKKHSIFSRIKGYIDLAVDQITAEQNEAAYTTYKQMVEYVTEETENV